MKSTKNEKREPLISWRAVIGANAVGVVAVGLFVYYAVTAAPAWLTSLGAVGAVVGFVVAGGAWMLRYADRQLRRERERAEAER